MATSANTSATGGPIAPISAPPADDVDLDVIVQVLIAGITGIPRTLVRPRWQETAPRIPDPKTNWVAVEVTAERPYNSPATIWNGTAFVLRATSDLDVMASFYGPKSNAYARLVADMLWVSQNREYLLANGMAFKDVGPLRRAPEITATRTRRRTDLPIVLTRSYDRALPILPVVQAVGTVYAGDRNSASPSVDVRPFAAPEKI